MDIVITDRALSPITSFRGEYRFLSNFYPVDIYYNGRYFRSVEHAYQAAKTVVDDQIVKIQNASTPGDAKRLGKHVTKRSDWDSVKLDVMKYLVTQKFTYHPYLRDLLVFTGGRELVEGNTWGGAYWGVCNGKGENHLGKILMDIRRIIS